MPRQASAETRARISRGVKRHWERERIRLEAERQAAQVFPQDIRTWLENGWLREELQPLIDFHNSEHGELCAALGGVDELSPQKRSLLHEHFRLGVAASLVTLHFFRKPERTEDASRLATIASTRLKLLQALGLERAQKDVPDLRRYIETRSQEIAPQSAKESGS